jgi:hypothetical protein
MLPADTIVRAAARWLGLLRTSTLGQASTILKADAAYTDLTLTQYSSGLELLRALRLVLEGTNGGVELSRTIRNLPDQQVGHLLFESILEWSEPSWLPDADVLVPDPGEIPQDAAALAGALGVGEQAAYSAIQVVRGHIDLEQRRLIGLAGERALLKLLESRWPRSTTHVAEASDGFGYDILFRHEDKEWHLEVKTTTRRGRLIVHLSRHEYEVSLHDPQWRLIVVGMDEGMRLKAVATVREEEIRRRSPRDLCSDGRWESAAHDLTARDLQAGLNFINEPFVDEEIADYKAPPSISLYTAVRFTWLPQPTAYAALRADPS